MIINCTKKLAVAMSIKPAVASEPVDPLFAWTANWINTFENRKEDMVVMINNATRFTVAIYGVKHNQFKDIAVKMENAVRNTLLALNINAEVVDDYMRRGGEVSFCANHDRKLTSWVNRQGLEASLAVGQVVNESRGEIKYRDTLGYLCNDNLVNYSSNADASFKPREKMLEMLAALTDKPIYQYRAFELLVTLDLECYKAVRRLIVPADLTFSQLHKVLQKVYSWKSYHLYDFAVFDGEKSAPVVMLVTSMELNEDDSTILMEGHKLSEYLPQNKFILYTYDMGDNWEHQIEVVRVLENYSEESPYLLEVVGQAPPEDVGGVGGFIDFYEIMCNKNHPQYEETKKWAGYWLPELYAWESRPRAIRT